MPKKIRPGLSRRDMEMRFAGELCRICHRTDLIAFFKKKSSENVTFLIFWRILYEGWLESNHGKESIQGFNFINIRH